MSELEKVDPNIAEIIRLEERRQQSTIELIASENFTSAAVMEAVGSVLTNKYAEGLPGKRYYGGCEFVDQAENLAIDRARQLFGAFHANVQPHSGASANLAAYLSVLKPGDRILGMNLSEGGHLTHGSPVNFSGQIFEAHFYGVSKDNETIDYDVVRDVARRVQPKMIVCGASAYSRTIDFSRFREIADEVGAFVMADIAHIAGIVAAGKHPTPIGSAHLTTTTTHKTLRGPRGGMIMADEERAAAVNKTLFPGLQGGPLMHVIAGKAVAFGEALQPAFSDYIDLVLENARVLSETVQEHGLRVVSGGTDNHLLLVDLTTAGISGRKAERALEAAGITVNKNAIPNDSRPPMQTSGIRLGTPAVSTRGFSPDDMRRIGSWIADIVHAPDDEALIGRIGAEVHELAAGYPLPGVGVDA
ncbi:MAG TPA: serine hydroxymethyltransferase [Thermomicrobiales bacterium]|nr:serine hydroxymethyltransferase [Thermomicrobiales bacterium]HRA32818.1 serine hydroxymethyltransferase [Thermomicrobiales bacterium]